LSVANRGHGRDGQLSVAVDEVFDELVALF
jgi:hypothetical protein